MTKVTLSDISNLSGNPGSAQTVVNSNNLAIETAIENTLSRDGTAPNGMGADLDMNGNNILNVGDITYVVPATAAEIGAALYPISAAETAAGLVTGDLTLRYPYGDVRRYGAAGDGTTDDTAAIQAAIGSVVATGGEIWFPPGVYLVTDEITVTSDHAISLTGSMGPDHTSTAGNYIKVGASISGAVFNVSARGGRISGLWFRDPTSTLGGTQGSYAIDAAIKLTVFGMGVVEDCAFDGLQGSAVEALSWIRGHLVRPHIRDCGTASRPAIWLHPSSSLSVGQICIDAPHAEVCRGVYLKLESDCIDNKIIGGQFEADTALAASNQYFIHNAGQRTTIVGCGFNKNTATQVLAANVRGRISACHFAAASGATPATQLIVSGNFYNISGCDFVGTPAATGTAISDTGGNNFFTGCQVYYGGNVVLGASSVWSGGGCYDLKTSEAYAIVAGTNATVSGAFVGGADNAGGINAGSGAAVTGCNVLSNAGVGILCSSSTATIIGNRASGNTGGNYSFSAYPHGYSPNSNYSGDGVYPLQASTTWDPASIADGDAESKNVTVTGAAVGDSVDVAFPMLVSASGQAGMQITASVYTANTVKVTISNHSGGAVNLDSGTLVVKVTKV